jgi:hypothetical protein
MRESCLGLIIWKIPFQAWSVVPGIHCTYDKCAQI